MKAFISFSSEDRTIANELVELFRLNYIKFFFSERSMRGEYFMPQIEAAIYECSHFVLLVSPDSIKSKWVQWEIEKAMAAPHLKGKVYPVIIRETDNWKSIHQHIGKLQTFKYFEDPDRAMTRLLEEEFHVPRLKHEPYRAGKVMVQVIVLAGGNGRDSYQTGDIVCDGPTDARVYQLPTELERLHQERVAKLEAAAAKKNQTLFNGTQIRLDDYGFGGPNETGGISRKPLRLKFGWTKYYNTRLTNGDRHFMLPESNQTILQKYGPDPEDFSQCRLSNPIATNLSVVSSDRRIYLSTRSMKVSWNPGQLQPAVSGDGQPGGSG